MNLSLNLARILWTIFSGGGMIVLGVLAVVWVQKLLKVKNAREESIKLHNLGNVDSIFYITLESPESKVTFKISSDGKALVEVPPSDPTQVPVEADLRSAGMQLQEHSPQHTVKGQSEQAIEKGRGAVAKTGALASFLGMLAGLLPGSMGSAFRQQSNAVRDLQTGASKVNQSALSSQRKVSSLKTESRRITKLPGNDPRSPGGSVATSAKKPVVIEQTVQQEPVKPRYPSTPGISFYQVQTPLVAPGNAADLILQIDSRHRRYPTESFQLTLETLQSPDELYGQKIGPLQMQRTVNFEQVAAWRYWVPDILSLAVIGVTVWGLASILKLIWS